MKKYIDRLIEELIKAENELECRAEIEEIIEAESICFVSFEHNKAGLSCHLKP